MNLSNLKISTRLALGFALVLLLLIGASLLGMYELHNIAQANRDMLEKPLTKERLLADWSRNVFGAVRRTSAIVKSTDDSLSAYFEKDAQAVSKSSTEITKQLQTLLETDEEKALFDQIAAVRKRYTDSRNAAMKEKAAGNLQEAARIFTQEHEPSAQQYEDSIDAFLKMQRKNIDNTKLQIEQHYQFGARLLVIITILGVILGVVCAIIIRRSIVRPISYAVQVANTVANGDLTHRIEVRTTDETGQLLQALRTMNANLARTVASIRTGAETISSASSQIAAGNADLSSRTEEQAASLEETAASMEEMSSTVKQNADNARQANQLAATASEVAERGGAAVAEVVETMTAISASSNKISDIVSVIDGIAFQTNILALNAAVEAARAGEQGKGFAVVAGEVRSLAQRSAHAAKEIKDLIEDSVSKVSMGASQVERAGATMQEIVTSVKRVTDIMGEITAASDEQARGVEQVNTAISQMDEVTQQNAALVEESAAAAGAMQDQAAELVRAVAAFKTGNTQVIEATPVPQGHIGNASKPAKPARPATAKPAPASPTPRLAAKPAAQESKEDSRKSASADDDWTSF